MPNAHLRVWRGEEDGEYKEYDVEYEEGMVVLDVVHRLQATQTPDLAVRWNCKAGKCGSCSAEVNGTPKLQCMLRMELYPEGETISIAPLKTFPLIRDLVTDVAWNYEKAKTIPEIKLQPREADGTHRMAQIDVDRGQEFRKCIECFICQDVCHVIRDHPENMNAFAGPRFFVRLAEISMHPLDTNPREDTVQHGFGLEYCNITKCCTDVCPEGIHITDNAIIPLKERSADIHYDPLRALGRKLFGKS
ncbi:MAG: succinate dehydrogenase/fumarate reductase iron-sulfur subunit [Dehalococcoidia bacterium]|jgi:succinate dehydrogenase / fumarate reductase, iron-sulfur subunit|nr:succinate dehydrogenase/fumarate reductase iron-sulfur subunit [Dehalococcoidia bacterium]